MLLKKPLPWVQDVAHEVQSHWCSNTPLLGKPSSRVHCQKKQDHIWCGGNKWLWHALGAGEVQLRRWVLETRWAPSHKGSNVTHSSKNVFLWPPLLLLSVFMWQTHSCFKTFGAAAGSLLSEGAHTQTKVRQAPLGQYHGTVSTSILWITQLGSVTKSTRWPILGQLMVLSSAVSLIKEEKTGVGWDLPLGRSSHRHLAHQHLFTEGFCHTPNTFPPSSPISTCTTSKSPHHPWGRWHTSLHMERWDSFLLQRPCGCHHLSDQASTSVLCSKHHKVVCSALCDIENQSEVIEEEGGGAAWCKELQCSPGLSPCRKGCDPGLGACSLERHWELWNAILRLLAVFPWAGHSADTVTLKAQLPVASWLPKAPAWGSWAVPKLTLPGGTLHADNPGAGISKAVLKC